MADSPQFVQAVLAVTREGSPPLRVVFGGRGLTDVSAAALANAAGVVLSELCRAGDPPGGRSSGSDRSPA